MGGGSASAFSGPSAHQRGQPGGRWGWGGVGWAGKRGECWTLLPPTSRSAPVPQRRGAGCCPAPPTEFVSGSAPPPSFVRGRCTHMSVPSSLTEGAGRRGVGVSRVVRTLSRPRGPGQRDGQPVGTWWGGTTGVRRDRGQRVGGLSAQGGGGAGRLLIVSARDSPARDSPASGPTLTWGVGVVRGNVLEGWEERDRGASERGERGGGLARAGARRRAQCTLFARVATPPPGASPTTTQSE